MRRQSVQAVRWWGVLTLLLTMMVSVTGQGNLPVFRVGVLDSSDGALTRGAQLAVQEINDAGGVLGADGTRFQLQLVIQSPDDISTAVANIDQASVIAVIGPEDSQTMLASRSQLASLGVPVLTTAVDDTLINDDGSPFFRVRARAFLQGRALADYLINELSAASLTIVQLDVESTVETVGFSQAASQLGLTPTSEYVLSEETSLETIIQEVSDQQPQFLVAYGPPQTAAQLYMQLRQSEWAGLFAYNRAGSATFRANVQESQLQGILGSTTWSYTYPDDASIAFTLDYLTAFGDVPGAIDAAAYDALYLLQEAIGNSGSLAMNLRAIVDYEGVQGVVSPSELPPGEMSSNVAITELGRFGAPVAVARYRNNERVGFVESEDITPDATATPLATATPDGVTLEITRAIQNVRTGPGLNYDILGQLQQGETARVIGGNIDLSWVAIEFRGTTGWLSRAILELSGDTTTIPVLPTPPTPTPPPATPTPLATATPTQQPLPDLAITGATPERLTLGESYSVTVTVRNSGASDAGTFAVAASLLPGEVYSSVTLNGLAAGAETTIALNGTLGNGPTGFRDVGIVADLNDQVDEGSAGEQNNVFSYIYVADAPLYTQAPATGNITLNDFQTAAIDGNTDDIQWSAGGIVPMGNTRLARLSNFNNFTFVHRDAVQSASLANSAITPVSAGDLIAIRTDGPNVFGVIEVLSATANGEMTFRYRLYALPIPGF